jgi:glutaredoxin
MEFPNPDPSQFTVYSKSGCPNCNKVKNLLKANNIPFNVIDCDEYVLECKTDFLLFIKTIAKQECNMFPMVFVNAQYIGGYNETNNHIECLKAQTLDFDVLF